MIFFFFYKQSLGTGFCGPLPDSPTPVHCPEWLDPDGRNGGNRQAQGASWTAWGHNLGQLVISHGTSGEAACPGADFSNTHGMVGPQHLNGRLQDVPATFPLYPEIRVTNLSPAGASCNCPRETQGESPVREVRPYLQLRLDSTTAPRHSQPTPRRAILAQGQSTALQDCPASNTGNARAERVLKAQGLQVFSTS